MSSCALISLLVATPFTFQRYTYNRDGVLFGWDMNSHQMMLHQIQNRCPIKNLFLCGAWTIPAGGVSAIMSNATTTAKFVSTFLSKKNEIYHHVEIRGKNEKMQDKKK